MGLLYLQVPVSSVYTTQYGCKCLHMYIFLTFQLFDVVYREETLLNVIRSVTRNGRSIILTAVLALILVYMFSIIGYMFFKDDFLLSVDQDVVGKYQSL
jgi:inositol 1,4,5-triphosphate receptor type 1